MVDQHQFGTAQTLTQTDLISKHPHKTHKVSSCSRFITNNKISTHVVKTV